MGPVTILITELLGLPPTPFLMAQALLSDTADIGTSVGDPASVLVSAASGYNFTDFLTHAMPIVIVATMVTLLMLRYLFSRELAIRPANPKAVVNIDADEALQNRPVLHRVLIVLTVAIGLLVHCSLCIGCSTGMGEARHPKGTCWRRLARAPIFNWFVCTGRWGGRGRGL